jgi:hypothetical protein
MRAIKRPAVILSSALTAIAAAALTLIAIEAALACACCTNVGQRNVGTYKLDASKRSQVEEVRYGETAELFVGEADVTDVKGIATPSDRYALTANWQKDRLEFAFRDEAGRNGTLALPRPATISVFEVDPRAEEHEGGNGPALYKEWKLTAKPSGSGVFNIGLGPNQLLTLVLQGRGNSCTDASDFTHWTLVMQGPKANYTFFGNLIRSR